MLRVGVVGLGSWGPRLAAAFAAHPGVLITATYDRAPRPPLPGAFAAASLAELLGACDAVAVATPPEAHAPVALAALRADRHVFVEKPLAHSLAAATEVRLAAQAATGSSVCAVGHVLRFHPAVAAAETSLRAGHLGDLRRVVAIRTSPKRPATESPWWNLAPHDVSLANAAFDAAPMGVSAEPRAPGCIAATLLFSGGRSAELLVEHGTARRLRRFGWFGTERTFVFDDAEGPCLVTTGPRAADPAWLASDGALDGEAVHLDPGDALAREVDGFVRATAGEREVLSGVEEGWHVVAALDAGERSLREGGTLAPRAWPACHLTRGAAE